MRLLIYRGFTVIIKFILEDISISRSSFFGICFVFFKHKLECSMLVCLAGININEHDIRFVEDNWESPVTSWFSILNYLYFSRITSILLLSRYQFTKIHFNLFCCVLLQCLLVTGTIKHEIHIFCSSYYFLIFFNPVDWKCL